MFLKITGIIIAFALSILPVFAGDIIKMQAVPKNIILFIGDGMGVAQITAGKIVTGTLSLERFKHLGLLMTYSQNDLITDSAAAGTALATGYKTTNGSISMTSDGRPLKTVLEYAQQANKATGMVVTSSITHATPAVFAAHTKSRKQHSLIAEQIASSGIDVLFGGGRGYFIPLTMSDSKRWDNKNLLSQMSATTTIIHTPEEFDALGDVSSVAGFFAKKQLPEAEQRNPSLPAMTNKAIEILAKNNQGFFLMVEGSQIDWAGHNNDQDYLIKEVIDFDTAVAAGLDFAQHNGQTLVLVTADHETGGFAIHDGSIEEQQVSDSAFTRKSHTAEMVPIFAYGPGASRFSGIADDTKVGKILIQFLTSQPLNINQQQ